MLSKKNDFRYLLTDELFHIEQVSDMTFFGLIIDDKITFIDHIHLLKTYEMYIIKSTYEKTIMH